MSEAGPIVPLHQRIAADLEAKILSGAWPPGYRIPFEQELAAQYGCARMTANKAVSALAAAGLIIRRRRAGSFVAQPPIGSMVLRIPDMQAEAASRGETYGYELIARHCEESGGGQSFLAGKLLIVLKCRHLSDGRPFALEQRLINLDAVPEARGADFTRTPPGSWLLARVPWTRAEHDISAANADAATAKGLAIPEGAACLVVERRTWKMAEEVTQVRQIFPGAAYRLRASRVTHDNA